MKKYTNSILILLYFICTCHAYANASVNTSIDDQDKNDIQQKSKAWNTAFSTRDVSKILPFLSEDVQMASAGGKWQTPEGTEKFFLSLFKRRPDITWINDSKEITINPVWHVAYEIGDWTETWTEPDGTVEIKGKYFALWKKTNDNWLLNAMIFTPLNCNGSSEYCQDHTKKKKMDKEAQGNSIQK